MEKIKAVLEDQGLKFIKNNKPIISINNNGNISISEDNNE